MMGHCQKEVEMVFEATKSVAEPLPPNQSQEVVWLTHVSRTIHHGYAKPLKSYLFRKERSQLEMLIPVNAVWLLVITVGNALM